MDEVKLTASQAADNIGEKVHTLRNWMKYFRDYIPFEKDENGYNLYTQESINVLRIIQKMYRDQKLNTRQIEAILAGADKPTVKDEEERSLEAVEAVRELLEEQRAFNAVLVQKLDEQQQQFEQFVQRRDEQIMYVLRELQEQRKQLPGARSPWWKRWFKGGYGEHI